MSDDPPVTALVTRAANGDRQAWEALVERYAPLIWSICRRYQLADADAGDLGQTVWLQLLAHLGELREPAALASWLATTTRRECARARRTARRPHLAGHLPDAESIPDTQTPTTQLLLAAEQHAALREAFTRLPSCCQELLALLTGDPPAPYAQISDQLGIPVGSIGPRRGRCLSKLRRDPAIAALLNPEAAAAGDEPPSQAPDAATTITY